MMAIKTKTLFFFLIFLFLSYSFQAQKKYVTEADYEKWTSMSAANLSKDGKWAYYNISNIHIRGMSNPKKPADTLELTELETLKRFIYPFGTKPKFSDNNKWFTCLHENQFVLLDLKTQEEQRFDSVQSYELALNGTLSLMRIQNKDNLLRILNTETKEVFDIPNVLSYSLNPDKTSMVILEQLNSMYTLKKFDLDTPQYSITLKDNLNYSSQFRWSESGNLFAFYEEKTDTDQEYKDHVLHCLNLKNPAKNKTLKSAQLKKGFYLNSHVITFSNDESTLNLSAFPIYSEPKNIDPVIWNTTASTQPPLEWEYPKKELLSWNLKDNKLKYITSDFFPIISGDLKHFFYLRNTKYLPDFKHGGNYNDIIFINSITGENKLIDTNIIVLENWNVISISPNGNYIAWAKENNWWIYDIKNDSKFCITCNIKDDFTIPFDSENNKDIPFNFARFSENDHDIILTSKNRIWKYDFKLNKLTILIENKTGNYTFKLMEESKGFDSSNYVWFKKCSVSFSRGIFLLGYNEDTNEESLYLYNLKNGLKHIISSPHKITSPRKADSIITFTLSNFNLPPQIMLWENNKTKVIRQSNQQQENYYWGHSQLITYSGPNNSILKGALFYPGNYLPDKSYPILIHIYSEQSLLNLKKYIPLTLENAIGWNTSRFSTQDYFVFYPDIKYKINHPGQSALQSVLTGVEAIKNIPGVDTTRMGLFGQSFGGFEVSYIATQTNTFKTIVSSAGSHDLIDSYLILDDSNRTTFWRFEQQQYRITAPYYSQTFIDNSPILQAYKIETPMLLIAGKKDFRVFWHNSVKMQLALTRLEKVSSLLLYKDGEHILTKRKDQIDLSIKLKQWFDYYLKETPKPHWN